MSEPSAPVPTTDALPQLRAELELTDLPDGVQVDDPLLGRSMKLPRREGVLVRSLLAGADRKQLEASLAEAGEPRLGDDELDSFGRALDRLHLLEELGTTPPVIEAMRGLLLAPLPEGAVVSRPLTEAETRTVPLAFHPEVRYTCTGCGVCCQSFLLGPLRPADVGRLERLRWPAGVRLPVGSNALTHLDDEGEQIPFLRTFRGGCVFLGDDSLCEIHREFDAATKPLVCRLFPYTFTRLGRKGSARIAVSLQFESRALWSGHATGAPLSESEAYLRGLLAELGSVSTLPESVPLTEARRIPLRNALRIDEQALRRLDAAPSDAPPSELARRALGPLVEALTPGSGKKKRGKRGPTKLSGAGSSISSWLEAQLAWQQEIDTGLVPLLPGTVDAQRDLLIALEDRRRGRRAGPLGALEASAFFRSWLRAAIHGRDAYRSPDLVSGWVRNVLRIAVTGLLVAPDEPERAGSLHWPSAAVRCSKLFQIGHAPDRPALWALRGLSPARKLGAVVGWLKELEDESLAGEAAASAR